MAFGVLVQFTWPEKDEISLFQVRTVSFGSVMSGSYGTAVGLSWTDGDGQDRET